MAELELATKDKPLVFDHGNVKNAVLEYDKNYQILRASLEMKGFSVDGKTIIQFESAIESLHIVSEEKKKQLKK